MYLHAYVQDPSGESSAFWKAARKEWVDWNWGNEPLLPLVLSYLGALDNSLAAPNPHRAGFDAALLTDVLRQVGFAQVSVSTYMQSHEQLLRVDNVSDAASTFYMDSEGNKQYFSLFVDAIK